MRKLSSIGITNVVLGLLVVAMMLNPFGASATHAPADKVWVSASTMEIMKTQLGAGGPSASQSVVLSRSRVKFSTPTDLLLQVTAECALWTNVATTGNDDSESTARVEIWITLDGKTVPVAAVDPDPLAVGTGPNDPDQQAELGRVVFCNRAHRMKTENFDDNNAVIRSFIRSRSANAFNWGAMNVGVEQPAGYDSLANGNNIIDIEVHARLAAEVVDTGTDFDPALQDPAAKAAVGKRTLLVEPTKMANDIAF